MPERVPFANLSRTHYRYRLNEFLVESDVPLSCDDARDIACLPPAEATLAVRWAPGGLRAALAEARLLASRYGGAVKNYAMPNGDGVLVRFGDGFLLQVSRAGDAVILDAPEDTEEARAAGALFTVGAGVALASVMRGRLALHAACADMGGADGDGRVAILARSGTGKSTTLFTLLRAGARLVSDDVVPVRLEAGRAMATPSLSLRPKVSLDLLEREGIAALDDLTPVRPDDGKLWWPVPPDRRSFTVAPLAALFVLRPEPETSGSERCETPVRVRAERVCGAEAIPLLIENTMGPLSGAASHGAGEMLLRYAALVRAAPLYTLTYPRRFEALPELVRTIRSIAVAETADT